MLGMKPFGALGAGGRGGGGLGRRAALFLDFVNGMYKVNRQRRALADIMTIAGGVNGTRVNSVGLIEAATRTNLLAHSNDFSQASWVAYNVLTPTGRLESGTASSDVAHQCYQLGNTIEAGRTYGGQAKAKAGEVEWLVLNLFDGVDSRAYFNLRTGVKGGVAAGFSSEMVLQSDGYYRCSIFGPMQNASVNGGLSIEITTADGLAVSTIPIGEGVRIKDSQFEQQPRPTAYIETGATAVTATQSPRFDYDPVTLAARGVLIEEQRTNLLTYSADFASGDWFKNNITAGASIVSPTGATDAALMQEDTNTGYHSSYYVPSLGTVTGTYSLTGFLKPGGRDWMMLGMAGFPSVTYFDSDAVAVGNVASGATASIADFGGGWSRAAVSQSLTAVALTYEMILAQANGGTTYTGDGTSGGYPYGRQLELGAFPTSYIPTTGSAVTRTADSLTMTGTDFSDWWNQAEGTIVVKFRLNTIAAGTTGCVFDLSSASNNTMICYRDADKLMMVVVDANSVQFAREVATVAADTDYTFAFAYADGDFAMSLNGAAPITEVGTVPVVPAAGFGCRPYDLSTHLNGHLQAFAYEPRRLSNSMLQSLS